MEGLTQQQVAQLTFLKAKLKSLPLKVKNILTQGQRIANDPSQLFLFKGMFRELKPYLDAFNDTWDKLDELARMLNLEGQFPSDNEKALRQSIESHYYTACAIYEEHMNPTPQGPSTSHALSNNSSNNDSRAVRTRLPQINLPTFDGDQTEWPLFRDTYSSLVHQEPVLSDIEKFHFLTSCLKGPALSLLKGIPLQESNYPQAWKLITDYYDDKRRLANSYLRTILNFQPLRNKPSTDMLKQLLTTVVESITSFKQLAIPHADDFILFSLLLRCLDPQTRREFEKAFSHVQFPSCTSLTEFLREELRSLELSLEDFSLSSASKVNSGHPKNASVANFRSKTSLLGDQRPRSGSSASKGSATSRQQSNVKRLCCPVCGRSHTLYWCPQFKHASPQERLELLKGWSGCINCLSSKHSVNNCQSVRNCPSCSKRHHSWLHVESSLASPDQHAAPSNDATSIAQADVSLSAASPSTRVILGTALVKCKDAKGRYQPIRLVVDCGSQSSFMTTDCAKSLGLQIAPLPHSVSGIGDIQLPQILGKVNCSICSRFASDEILVSAIVVPRITGDLPHARIPQDFQINLSAFTLADPGYWNPQPIDFLLGADLYFDIVTGAPIQISPGLPKLVPTTLGHIVTGRCHNLQGQHSSTSLLAQDNSEMQKVMSRFWEIEEVARKPPLSEEELSCECHFVENYSRLPSGRYVVALPFKATINKLQNPTRQVENRLFKLENRLAHSPELKNEYHVFMSEYLSLGHMSVAPDIGRYLIPHHCVSKMEGNKRKLRVVFDASCNGSHGSLNSHLMVGPKLQKDICDIILKFRCHQIAIVADIIKMYRQVLIRPEDRVFQHILWRSDPKEHLQEFQLNTVTYGVASSAFLAIRALHQLAKDEGHTYPLAAKVLTNDIYVDDIVTGASNLQEALKLQEEIIRLLRKGEFELSKWKSNVPELLDSVLEPKSDDPFALSPQDDSGYKVLGLQWLPRQDIFTFCIEAPTAPTTKRGILSTIARIYDPLGFLAPVVFWAKALLQDLWMAKCDWDEEVPYHIHERWSSFAEKLPSLANTIIPRHIPTLQSNSRHLLGFADASQKGYAAVVYIQLRFSDPSSCATYLLKAKTKLAPTRLVSIPRLELCAALLLSRLFDSCKSIIDDSLPIHISLFTDSTVVLGWLRAPLNRQKAFVAHRVSEILALTNLSFWHHVTTESNPADIASRGLMPHLLPNHLLWWTGPSWLEKLPEEWPRNFELPDLEELPELKPVSNITLLAAMIPDLIQWMEGLSSYLKIIRSMCYVLRFIKRIRGFAIQENTVSLGEMESAKTMCLKLVQKRYLPPFKTLVASKPWRAMSVFLDPHGLVRVGGRLSNSSLTYERKHPIVLPNCHFTRLLVNYYHVAYLHIGASSLQAMLQGRYMCSSRNIIRTCVRKCVKCQLNSANPRPPLMGDLPSCRLQEGQVFQHVGVDLAGPFPLKESSRRKAALGKAYLAVFVCMVTRALHLEIVSSCSTEAFLAALHRFASRRGIPQHLYSDCGKNFIGTASTLVDLKKWWNSEETQSGILRSLSEVNISWHFNPPRSPHFGGLWEAGVKSAKSLMFRNLQNTALTYEELSTLFSRVEAVLNSRPLYAVSSEVESFDYLSPGHFLIGRPLISVPEESLVDAKDNILRRWQLIQQRLQHFWKRWRLSYLNQLQQRRKWTKISPNLEEGDLVVIKEADCPVTAWPVARVIKTHPGRDGIVRVATIKTPAGIYTRPVIKLAPLLLPTIGD